MSILTFIDKVCVQSATYWGAPASDGYGGFTFAKPTAIKVRWDERVEVISTREGKEYSSRAVVMTNTDADEGGYLFLGTSAVTDPRGLSGAFEIVRVDRVPLFKSTTEFVKTIYL